MRALEILILSLLVSACATAQLHSETQLNAAGSTCGLRLGELIQDEEEMRLLLVIRGDTTTAQKVCVSQWARRNHLKAVFVDMEFPQS